jgi:hypothetical protein
MQKMRYVLPVALGTALAVPFMSASLSTEAEASILLLRNRNSNYLSQDTLLRNAIIFSLLYLDQRRDGTDVDPQNREDLFSCGEETGIDIDSVLEAAEELDVENSDSVRPSQVGLSNSEAKRLSRCMTRLSNIHKQVTGFNTVLPQDYTMPEEHRAFTSEVGDRLSYSFGDYSFCRETLASEFRYPVNSDDIKTFNQCTREHVTPVEQVQKYTYYGMIGLLGLAIVGVGGLVVRDMVRSP